MNSPEKKRVLLTTDFKPMAGGIAEYLHSLWNHLAACYPVIVMTSVQQGKATYEHSYHLEALPELPQRRLGDRLGDPMGPLRKINTARYFYDLGKYAQETLDLILKKYGNEVEPLIGVWSTESHFWCRELRKAGIPYSLHVHGLEVVYPYYGRLPSWRHEDFLGAKGIITVSKGTAELVKSHFGKDIPVYIVNPGVGPMPDRRGIESQAMRLKEKLNLCEKNILLTVGRLVARKGIDLVLGSVKELVAEFPNLYYVVAGDGPERSRLRQLARDLGIEDSVCFLGEVDEKTKWALYKLCDVFVMPNRLMGGTDWEGFGIVFLEAALSSKPSIGGNNGGTSDAIEHKITGFLVDPENRREISISLVQLLRDQNLREKMGLAAEKRARMKFNWQFITEDFLGRQGLKRVI